MRLSDLLGTPAPSQAEAEVRETVKRETFAAFLAGGRSAVLPTAAEQEAKIQQRLAAPVAPPASLTRPVWRRRGPLLQPA